MAKTVGRTILSVNLGDGQDCPSYVMPYDHSHVDEHLSDCRLIAAVALNLLLTLVETVADALHNFNDCGSLVIALVARLPSDHRRTFGYRRAHGHKDGHKGSELFIEIVEGVREFEP